MTSSTHLPTPGGRAYAGGRADVPPASELAESLLVLVTGGVLAGPMLPGFVLTVPALILFAVVVLAPVVAAAALVTVTGAILAIPYLLVRAIRGIRSRYRDRPAAADMGRPRVAARVLG